MKRAVWLAVSTLIFVVLVAGFIVPPQPLLQLISSTPSPLPMPTPAPRTKSDSIGICVHSLPEKDAQLVSQSGAQWIRIDCNSSDSKFGDYLRNAKAYNLSVLAILDGWMFSGNTDFTLED